MKAPKVSKATRTIHKKDLKACKKAALRHWTDEMVEQVVNLEWSPKSIQEMGQREGATSKQIGMLIDLHEASKLEFASFAISRMGR